MDRNTEKLMDMISEDEIVLGTILLDRKTGGILMNIPLLKKLNPSEDKMSILQESVDKMQQFFIETLLSKEELDMLREEVEKEIEKFLQEAANKEWELNHATDATNI